MIDAKTEAAIGKFPVDRKYYARAIDALRELGARGVILKFFLDLPKDAASDKLLADSIGKLPVFLQAGIQKEPKSNPLDPRFIYKDKITGVSRLITGKEGWIPLPVFSAAAAGLGFVDGRSEAPTFLPLLERYGNDNVLTLTFAILRFIHPDLVVTWGKSVSAGGRSLPMNDRGEVEGQLPAADSLDFISLADLLAGTVARARVEGRIVYLGYDGSEQPVIATKLGPVKAHRFYYYCLSSILGRLE
jgi:CHASE2 domain-containing sensor protein